MTMRRGVRLSNPGKRQINSGSSAHRRADADKDGVAFGAQDLHLGAGDIAGDTHLSPHPFCRSFRQRKQQV